MGPDEVLAAYEDRINRHDFDLLVPLIASDTTFWFSEGSYAGIDAIRGAFERTWASLNNDTYRLDGRDWIARGETVAACTYRFHWSTTVDGKPVSGEGRGTTVLRLGADGWRIVHEHLSSPAASG